MSKAMSKNRACVFINSSNSNQVIHLNSQPIIKIPFPPIIDPRDLVIKTKDGRIPARVPNAFIIYRKTLIETARNEGYQMPMTVISSMASQSWKTESEVVKAEYKRLAKEAYEIRNEMLPKSERKRKREKWNIITFEKQSLKGPTLKTQKAAKKEEIINESTTKIIPFPSPISSPEPISETSLEIPISSSPAVIPLETSPEIEQFDFDFTQYMTPNVQEIVDFIDFNNPNNPLLSCSGLSDTSSLELNSQNELNFESFPELFSDTPIITEEELFNLLPINNEDYQNNICEGLGIYDSMEFIPTLSGSEENLYPPVMYTNAEPSCGLDFGYSYNL